MIKDGELARNELRAENARLAAEVERLTVEAQSAKGLYGELKKSVDELVINDRGPPRQGEYPGTCWQLEILLEEHKRKHDKNHAEIARLRKSRDRDHAGQDVLAQTVSDLLRVMREVAAELRKCRQLGAEGMLAAWAGALADRLLAAANGETNQLTPDEMAKGREIAAEIFAEDGETKTEPVNAGQERCASLSKYGQRCNGGIGHVLPHWHGLNNWDDNEPAPVAQEKCNATWKHPLDGNLYRCTESHRDGQHLDLGRATWRDGVTGAKPHTPEAAKGPDRIKWEPPPSEVLDALHQRQAAMQTLSGEAAKDEPRWHPSPFPLGEPTLQTSERLLQERDAYKADLDRELAGNAALREKHGARDDETMFDFHARLVQERDAARAEAKKVRAELLHTQEALKQIVEPMRRISHMLEIAGVK